MTSVGGFTIVDFTIPTRDSPVVHPCATAPICEDCRSQDLCFFDPTCSGCQEILMNPKTTVSELFAIMRQWVPQTQRYLSLLAREVLRRGAHVDDKDSLTDLSLLHFACKAGALVNGGSPSNLVSSLIAKGANTNLKCHWTDMNALHYAVYFNCDEIVEQLCEHNPALVPSICNQFDRGNSLHIAAANLSLQSAHVLIKHKADGGWKDERNRLPYECIPDVVGDKDETIANELRDLLRIAADNRPQLRPRPATSDTSSSLSSLSTSKSSLKQSSRTKHSMTNGVHKPEIVISSNENHNPTSNGDAHSKPVNGFKIDVTSKTQPLKGGSVAVGNSSLVSTPTSHVSTPTSPLSCTTQSPMQQESVTAGLGSGTGTAASNSPEEPTLETLGIKIGDKVIVDIGTPKSKVGTLRFFGDTMFATGKWAGVELDADVGRNDGSHGGIRYFSCKPKRGLFVLLKRLSKYTVKPGIKTSNSSSGGTTAPIRDKGKKPSTTTTASKSRDKMLTHSHSTEYQVGERVLVTAKDMGVGVVRFVGSVKFGPGLWLGVELDRPKGTCDGSNGDVQYFKCRPNHGVFIYPSKVSKISDSKDGAERPSSGSSSASPINRHTTPPISRKKHAASPIVKSTSSSAYTRTKPRAMYTSPVPTSVSLANSPQPTLEKGMSVFTNKERGTLQYVGHTDFAPGLWLGIELKKPSGKNDGSVNGKRYFTCRANYGIFVKPEKATHRGINCSKLVKPSEH